MFAAAALTPVVIGLFSLLTNAPTYFALMREPDLLGLKDALYRLNDPFGIRSELSAEQKTALETYVVGVFGERIKNPDFWKSRYVATSILASQRKTAIELVDRLPPPSPEEVEKATEIVDPLIHLKDEHRDLTRFLPILIVLMSVGVWTWFEAIPSIIAAFFGGGMLWRIFGLMPVTADGRPASRLRFAWRQLIAWSPVLGLPIVAALILPLVQGAGAMTIWIALMLLAFAIIVASTMSKRSWPDRIAGTWLVLR
jgi:hypothetical protein